MVMREWFNSLHEVHESLSGTESSGNVHIKTFQHLMTMLQAFLMIACLVCCLLLCDRIIVFNSYSLIMIIRKVIASTENIVMKCNQFFVIIFASICLPMRTLNTHHAVQNMTVI